MPSVRPSSPTVLVRFLLAVTMLVAAAVVAGFFAARGGPVPSAADARGYVAAPPPPVRVSPTTPTPEPTTSSRAGAPRPTRVEQAEELLARQAAAVKSETKAAYLGTIDPQAEAFAQVAERTYDNLAKLDVTQYHFGQPREDAGALAPARRKQLGDTAWVADVEVEVTVKGSDPEPWRYEQRLVFVERDGVLYLAGDREGEETKRNKPIWLEAEINVLRGKHSLVFGTGSKTRLRPYVTAADRAVPRVTDVWGEFWAQYVVVVVPKNQGQMERIVGTDAGSQSAVAAVTTSVGRSHPELASHIVVNPSTFDSVGVLGRLVVLTHEITHVATHATVTGMPIWLSEGFADYVGFRDAGLSTAVVAQEVLRDVRENGAPKALPGTEEFDPSSHGLDEAYEAAWLACKYLAAHWNERKLVAFYRAMNDANSDAAQTAAYRTVLDTTPAEFLEGWRAYVEEKAGD